MVGVRAAVATLAVGAVALGATGCTGHHASLAKQCSAVFSAAATDAEGTCQGDDGPVHVYGTDCVSGQDLMAAEDAGGGDVAWARVGSSWHVLTVDGTNTAGFRACAGG